MNFLVITVVMLAIAVLWVLSTFCQQRKQAAFEERFPPISEEEFMQRCPPGTSRAVALKVRRIVADQLGIEYERIYPSSSFVGDLDCD
jgi:hypothetical protein